MRGASSITGAMLAGDRPASNRPSPSVSSSIVKLALELPSPGATLKYGLGRLRRNEPDGRHDPPEGTLNVGMTFASGAAQASSSTTDRPPLKHGFTPASPSARSLRADRKLYEFRKSREYRLRTWCNEAGPSAVRTGSRSVHRFALRP